MATTPLNIPINGATKLFDQTQLKLGINLADKLTPEKQTKIWMYMLDRFIRPQLDARRTYEKMWDLLYAAYRMRLRITDLKFNEDESAFVDKLKERLNASGNQDLVLTDSLIFDTVDRLSNITHYISWKDGKPVQFGSPEDFNNPLQDMMYSPTDNKHKSQNAVLSWSFRKEKAYGKSRLVNRDYYLYGIAYGISDLYFKLAGSAQAGVFLQDIGISYQPTSVRKVWLDWQLPISDMNQQPCPFWFNNVPIYKILSNKWEPTFNPMGYVNLDKVYEVCDNPNVSTCFIGGESWKQAIQDRLESMGGGGMPENTYNKVRALWSFMPMLPLDPTNGDFEFRRDKDGKETKERIPFRRFAIDVWGEDLYANKVVMIRCQDVEDHYEGELPIYGASHLDDLSSAAYSMSICEALINSAVEITLCMNYALENKNLINNPPSWHVTGGITLNVDVNKPNARIETLGPNEFGWRPVPDATQTTMGIADGIRDKAQATGRVTESILGKALGGRTTALEAGNLFETSMSQITTDINILNDAFHGGFGERVFTAYCKWLDPDLIKAITGSYGWPVDAIDHKLKIQLRTDVGSRYLTSTLKQQRIQYMLQAAVQSPVLDQTILWHEYTKEVGMPSLQRAIIDGGRDREIARAHDQACKTYLNEAIIIDPGQNHEIAMQVKTRFIEDTDSMWNQKYGHEPYLMTRVPRVMALSQQVAIHQNYLLVQQQMAAAAQMQQASIAIMDQTLQAQASAPRETQSQSSAA